MLHARLRHYDARLAVTLRSVPASPRPQCAYLPWSRWVYILTRKYCYYDTGMRPTVQGAEYTEDEM
jgi:hypothetical protein